MLDHLCTPTIGGGAGSLQAGQKLFCVPNSLGFEDLAEASQGAVDADLDRVHLELQHVGDLLGGEISSVAKREELSVTITQSSEGGLEREPPLNVLV